MGKEPLKEFVPSSHRGDFNTALSKFLIKGEELYGCNLILQILSLFFSANVEVAGDHSATEKATASGTAGSTKRPRTTTDRTTKGVNTRNNNKKKKNNS